MASQMVVTLVEGRLWLVRSSFVASVQILRCHSIWRQDIWLNFLTSKRKNKLSTSILPSPNKVRDGDHRNLTSLRHGCKGLRTLRGLTVSCVERRWFDDLFPASLMGDARGSRNACFHMSELDVTNVNSLLFAACRDVIACGLFVDRRGGDITYTATRTSSKRMQILRLDVSSATFWIFKLFFSHFC